jgi:hypothetical protein
MITLDRYGHLLPGNEEEAAGLLDGYLARAVAPAAGGGETRVSGRLVVEPPAFRLVSASVRC